MTPNFYKPQHTVSGPAYGLWFKFVATVITALVAVYGANIALRFPLSEYGFGVKALLAGAGLMLLFSYYWFLRSTVTIDDKGITQYWMYNRHVEWSNVHSAKLIGIPFLSAIFPPRLIVRAGNTFTTFNGGSQALLVEFARISVAFQAKK
ncbi:hypothetical protein [Noviherbaspirillum saxi]|uniref:Uncharacterized protein n=1 Tax=Noviherbaspirillum saxi TaxID=2320863 RepID=A0A3A3G4R9_9BURK|nr:hypothetical protein [Noviherbaspirillum saxi]RJF97115.1 hypothetical protein D3871_00130 [Noviherbaspirillum saxi]